MADTPIASADYAAWLSELKTRVTQARQHAVLAANRELVLLYWQIGRDIAERQQTQGWGAKVVERLARDLRAAFPDMRGFRHATSNTCGLSRKRGLTGNLCSRLLHNCHGSTSAHC